MSEQLGSTAGVITTAITVAKCCADPPCEAERMLGFRNRDRA